VVSFWSNVNLCNCRLKVAENPPIYPPTWKENLLPILNWNPISSEVVHLQSEISNLKSEIQRSVGPFSVRRVRCSFIHVAADHNGIISVYSRNSRLKKKIGNHECTRMDANF